MKSVVSLPISLDISRSRDAQGGAAGEMADTRRSHGLDATTPFAVQNPLSPFFKLSGVGYLIAKDATTEGLMGSASLLLGCGLSVLEANDETLNDAQWGAIYLMQQAHASITEALQRLRAEQRSACRPASESQEDQK